VKLGNWGFCGEDVSLRLGWKAPITWDFGIEKLITKKKQRQPFRLPLLSP